MVLRAEGVEKSFGGLWKRRVEVLKGASIRVDEGEFVALVGENGAGKSVFMKVIVGLMKRDAGEIEVDGTGGYCPQELELYSRLTCDEHFELFGRAYDMEREDILRRSDELYEDLRFAKYSDFLVKNLSEGTKQKLNLSIALMHEPDLLLLDEPYQGFDYDTYMAFWDMANDITAAGNSVLIISHMVGEEGRLDRIYQLREGKCFE
ncbi:MAG: putative branched-chain amino acid transport ATP-binding protein LivG [Methanonatronarchaeales archaeon]|nr:putative branched-chain amino acid transport ATP-binding protein LivG [Methanonatronarchaeales archaeon]